MSTTDADLPALPDLSYLGDDVSHGYDAQDMRAYARAAIEADRTWSAPTDAGSQP